MLHKSGWSALQQDFYQPFNLARISREFASPPDKVSKERGGMCVAKFL
jgi:hypothetical protein